MTSAEESAFGRIELLGDADRPGGWWLLIDRIGQSYVDSVDPTYLEFEYMQSIATVLDALPTGALAVTHVGGGACTLARYIAVTRPGSPQIVLEPDTAVTALIRPWLPFPRGARIRIRAVDGSAGVAALKDASADVVILDAFHGGRVPEQLTTHEFAVEIARVLRPAGVFLANVADGPPLTYSRRFARAVRNVMPEVLVIAEPAVLKGRRFGNVVLAASPVPLPREQIYRAVAAMPFRRTVSTGFGRSATPLTDADSLRSPPPPEGTWRVSGWHDD